MVTSTDSSKLSQEDSTLIKIALSNRIKSQLYSVKRRYLTLIFKSVAPY
jgi:hypothetical protein